MRAESSRGGVGAALHTAMPLVGGSLVEEHPSRLIVPRHLPGDSWTIGLKFGMHIGHT